MPKRMKTKYPGVFFREAERIGGNGIEKVFYIVFKKEGKVKEEKVGRQFVDDMSPARAAGIRAERIEGKRESRKETRIRQKAEKIADAGKWTIDKLFTEYMKGRADNKSRKTDTGRYEKHIKPHFENKEPNELLPLDVDRIRINLSKKLSPQTVSHILNLLIWTINFGVNKNLCEGIRFKIQKPSVDNIKTEDLTPEQLSSLLQAIDRDIHAQAGAIMKLALFTGMRRSEMFRLKWSDINSEKSYIEIKNPKGGKDQTIPLNDAAKVLLLNQPKTDSEYVFPGRDGKIRTDIKKAVNKIRDDAGLPKTFRALHGLRHVYASMLASSGQVDMYTLQKLLTHKSPAMTQRYAHLRDDTLKKASNLAGTLINEAISKNTGSKENIITIGKKTD